MPDLENNEAAEQEQEQQDAAHATDADAEAEEAEGGEDAEQNRADSAAAEEGEQAEEDGEEEHPEKKKGGFQRKIGKLTARASRAEREAEYWRQQALRTNPAASSDGRKTETTTTTEVADPGAKPKLADFETWDAYDSAVAEWLEKKARHVASAELKNAEQRRTQAEQERQRATTDQALEQQLEKREQAAVAKFPDFLDASEAMFETLAPLQGKPGCAFIARACMHEDPDGRLEHYLGTHPQEAVSIARMSETAAAIAIGKIIASKLAPQKSAAASATASKAPPPPRTLQKSSPTQTGLSDDLSDEEWLRRRNAQLRRKN